MLEIRLTDNGHTKQEYEKIYADEGICQLDSFYKWLLRLLSPQPGKLFLDVACGEGRLSGWAQSRGLNSHGVDFSERAARLASSGGKGSFTVGDGEALPYKNGCFDYVTSIGSLEHYRDPLKGIEEITRLLAPEGQALILLPNTFGIMHNVWTALRTGRPGMDKQPIQRYATVREWEDLLNQGGLRVVRIFKYEREFPTSWKDGRWYLGHRKNLVRLLLTPFIPLNWACCFVFKCLKNDKNP